LKCELTLAALIALPAVDAARRRHASQGHLDWQLARPPDEFFLVEASERRLDLNRAAKS
jgi:hypothetical protein